MGTSFDASDELCRAAAACGVRIASENVDPEALEGYVANRLIPLDKQPGVRPIGIGEVFRRALGKAVSWANRDEIRRGAGALQACAGLEGGCEAATHAVQEAFEEDNAEGVLLIDAENAFNALNRKAALHNIQHRAPRLARYLINTYRVAARLFVGGMEISSAEGTTQGDPLGTAMYAIAVVPLIQMLSDDPHPGLSHPFARMPELKAYALAAKSLLEKALETALPVDECDPQDDGSFARSIQVWFADDGTLVGRLARLRRLWDILCVVGPPLGYFPNGKKSVLVVKRGLKEIAESMFAGTGVMVTDEGQRHLGAAIGSKAFIKEYINRKLDDWVPMVRRLCEIAQEYPHSAHAAYTKGLRGKWNYFLRTIPDAGAFLGPLDSVIASQLTPVILGVKTVSDELLHAVSLPCRAGGLGMQAASEGTEDQYQDSLAATAPLRSLILAQNVEMERYPSKEIKEAKTKIHRQKEVRRAAQYTAFMNSKASKDLKDAVVIAKDPGASMPLSALPAADHGFHLKSEEWSDVMHMRYWLPIEDLPTICGCGGYFSMEHALQCSIGGFIYWRHNEIRDFFVSLISGYNHGVKKEPLLGELSELEAKELQALYKTSKLNDRPRGDLSIMGFLREGQRAFFDVRVWNHLAMTHLKNTTEQNHHHHERVKDREYKERIEECENGSFTPLIFSSMGSAAPRADAFMKQVAKQLEAHEGVPYANCLAYIRTKIGFMLMKSAVRCLRGTHKKRDAHEFNAFKRLYPHRRGVSTLTEMKQRTDLGAIEDAITMAQLRPRPPVDVAEEAPAQDSSLPFQPTSGPQGAKHQHPSQEASRFPNGVAPLTSEGRADGRLETPARASFYAGQSPFSPLPWHGQENFPSTPETVVKFMQRPMEMSPVMPPARCHMALQRPPNGPWSSPEPAYAAPPSTSTEASGFSLRPAAVTPAPSCPLPHSLSLHAPQGDSSLSLPFPFTPAPPVPSPFAPLPLSHSMTVPLSPVSLGVPPYPLYPSGANSSPPLCFRPGSGVTLTSQSEEEASGCRPLVGGGDQGGAWPTDVGY
jgi:hypothetical protein